MRRIFNFIALLFATIILQTPASASSGSTTELKQIPKTANIVTVGFFPVNVYGVDYTTSTFTFDGYIWFRWKGEIDPTKTAELLNAVDKSSISKEMLFETPQVMPDGSKYQIMRIESEFFKPFSLEDFPLDKHELSITIEDSLQGVDQLVYQIDEKDTSFSSSLSIAGWKLNGWSSKLLLNDYGSTFGDRSVAQASKFAQLSFSLNISRPESYFFWKLLLPLAIVLCGAWIALLLNPVLTETRAALPASALLTTVFLQQSYTTSLPETGGLVLIDKIYVIAYVLIVSTLARVILKSRKVEQMTEAEIQHLRKLDLGAFFIQVIIFIVGVLTIVLTR